MQMLGGKEQKLKTTALFLVLVFTEIKVQVVDNKYAPPQEVINIK